MGSWAAYVGEGSVDTLRRLLGGGAEIRSGDGFGLGALSQGGESATLEVDEVGHVTALLGAQPDSFCSARWNAGDRTLTAESDPFGLFTVYTARTAGAVWCASDLRLLQRGPALCSILDPLAVHGYLCFSHAPTPLSILSGASTLPAGTRTVI